MIIDENKVRLMTKIAAYEKKESNKDLVISKYYKSDYVRYNVLKSLIAATIVYWSLVAGYTFMEFEELLVQINSIDYFSVMYKLLFGYVLFCLFYFLFSSLVYNYRYSKAKKGLIEYNNNLKELIELQGGNKKKARVINSKDMTFINDIGDDFDIPEEKESSIKLSNGNTRGNVSRLAMVNQRLSESEKDKEKLIRENAERLNERRMQDNREKLKKERAMEEERERIKAHRMKLEQEQMQKLRKEREERMANMRENYTYQDNDTERRGR